jgi:GST-like protein
MDGLENLDNWKNKMYEQPGMLKGIKVPVDRESILKNDEDKKEFIKNAQKMVKK